jgi:hypothetical protein
MTYEESFLSTCDAEGFAPGWAIEQIFEEHGSDLDEYLECHKGYGYDHGETILHWLGY